MHFRPVLSGIRVRQARNVIVPGYLLGPGDAHPRSFLRHFAPVLSRLDRFFWTELPIDTRGVQSNPDLAALMALLPGDTFVPPHIVFPEYASYLDGGWADFYGFLQPPPWPISEWPRRCRGESIDPHVLVAFRCFEGGFWTMHSREETLLVEMKAAARHARNLVVEDLEPLPIREK